MTEKRLQRICLDFCQDRGILALKMDSSSSRGFPDLLLLTPAGRTVYVELKTPTGVVSPLQRRMHKKIRENNGEVYVVRSVEEFRAVVEAGPVDGEATAGG